jgi:hypothetical protein
MLSDAEQRRLTEIERALRSEDPHFVQRFRSDGRRGPHTCCGLTARVWLIVAALGMGLAVLAASAAMAAIALIPAGVSAGLWLADLSLPRDGRGPTHS